MKKSKKTKSTPTSEPTFPSPTFLTESHVNMKKNHADDVKETTTLFNKHVRAVKMRAEEHKPSFWYEFRDWLYWHNQFTTSISGVKTVETYLKMPYHKRHTWLFWYKPVYLAGNGKLNGMFGSKDERDKLETYLTYQYPIQYFLRKHGFALRIKLSRAHYWVCNTLNPRQKWLAKQIPKCWSDKPWLITELNFAMVIHFVDGEKCFENTEYEDGGAHQKFAEELRDCHDYVKYRRPKLQEEHENSYPNDETMTGDFNVDYAEEIRLESLINREDTKYLTWIVVNRDFLWT